MKTLTIKALAVLLCALSESPLKAACRDHFDKKPHLDLGLGLGSQDSSFAGPLAKIASLKAKLPALESSVSKLLSEVEASGVQLMDGNINTTENRRLIKLNSELSPEAAYVRLAHEVVHTRKHDLGETSTMNKEQFIDHVIEYLGHEETTAYIEQIRAAEEVAAATGEHAFTYIEPELRPIYKALLEAGRGEEGMFDTALMKVSQLKPRNAHETYQYLWTQVAEKAWDAKNPPSTN